MNTVIGSTSWWWFRSADDTDSIALYTLAAPDFLTFINEFESVQNHRDSPDVDHKESL